MTFNTLYYNPKTPIHTTKPDPTYFPKPFHKSYIINNLLPTTFFDNYVIGQNMLGSSGEFSSTTTTFHPPHQPNSLSQSLILLDDYLAVQQDSVAQLVRRGDGDGGQYQGMGGSGGGNYGSNDSLLIHQLKPSIGHIQEITLLNHTLNRELQAEAQRQWKMLNPAPKNGDGNNNINNTNSPPTIAIPTSPRSPSGAAGLASPNPLSPQFDYVPMLGTKGVVGEAEWVTGYRYEWDHITSITNPHIITSPPTPHLPTTYICKEPEQAIELIDQSLKLTRIMSAQRRANMVGQNMGQNSQNMGQNGQNNNNSGQYSTTHSRNNSLSTPGGYNNNSGNNSFNSTNQSPALSPNPSSHQPQQQPQSTTSPNQPPPPTTASIATSPVLPVEPPKKEKKGFFASISSFMSKPAAATPAPTPPTTATPTPTSPTHHQTRNSTTTTLSTPIPPLTPVGSDVVGVGGGVNTPGTPSNPHHHQSPHSHQSQQSSNNYSILDRNSSNRSSSINSYGNGRYTDIVGPDMAFAGGMFDLHSCRHQDSNIPANHNNQNNGGSCSHHHSNTPMNGSSNTHPNSNHPTPTNATTTTSTTTPSHTSISHLSIGLGTGNNGSGNYGGYHQQFNQQQQQHPITFHFGLAPTSFSPNPDFNLDPFAMDPNSGNGFDDQFMTGSENDYAFGNVMEHLAILKRLDE